ncbi:RDD family protein, partial [Streptomyces palmae]
HMAPPRVPAQGRNAPAATPAGAPHGGPPAGAAPDGGAPAWSRPAAQPAPGPGNAAGPEGVIPWKPPTDNPFLRAAQAQGRPAALGRRLVARLIDTVLLLAVVGAAAVPLWSKAKDHIDTKIDEAKQTGETVTVYLLDGTTGLYLGIVLGVLLLVGALAEALPTARWGRTLGKRLCGLRTLDIESHQPPSFGAALRRWLVYGVLGVLVVGVVNVLWCLFDRPWRQCWHDKAAHTFVASGS